MKNLEGKRILFIEPNFFGYEKAIYKELIRQGADVHIISTTKDNILWRISRYIKPIRSFFENRQFIKSFSSIQINYFDYVFIIRGGLIRVENLELLLNKFPKAFTILYLWDSIKENPSVFNLVPLFNKIFSFDQKDCENYGFDFLPLFYTSDFWRTEENPKQIYKFDIAFVGRDHSDRFSIIQKLNIQAKNLNLNIFTYLFTTQLGFFKRKFFSKGNYPNLTKKDFRFEKINLSNIAKIYEQSMAILDIELNIQSGLTMRTFELIASRKKMITTNKNIKEFKLYNKNNILIIDRKNPYLDLSFFDLPFVYDSRINEYSLENWIKNIFVSNN
jgi:hypothetical protein